MFDFMGSFMQDNVIGNLLNFIPPQLQGVAVIVSVALAIFMGRKQIFIRVIMRFFPNMFVKFMTNIGKSFNTFIEKKKKKGHLKDSWILAERKIIEAIDSFIRELKK